MPAVAARISASSVRMSDDGSDWSGQPIGLVRIVVDLLAYATAEVWLGRSAHVDPVVVFVAADDVGFERAGPFVSRPRSSAIGEKP